MGRKEIRTKLSKISVIEVDASHHNSLVFIGFSHKETDNKNFNNSLRIILFIMRKRETERQRHRSATLVLVALGNLRHQA